jgi:hypothetical protein
VFLRIQNPTFFSGLVIILVVLCAGAGVLADFDGAGSTRAKLRKHLLSAAKYSRTSAKKLESIDEKVNTRIDTA